MPVLSARVTGPTRSARQLTNRAWISLRPAGRRTERGHRTMEIVIAAALVAAGLVVAALLLVRRAPGLAAAAAPAPTRRVSADPPEPPRPPAVRDDSGARHQEVGRLAERLRAREGAPEARSSELDAREAVLEARLAG